MFATIRFVLTVAVGLALNLVDGSGAQPSARSQARPPLLDAKTRHALDAALGGYLAKHGIPGLSAAVSLRGSVIWAKGYGLADVENGVSSGPQTAYRSASIGKTIGATAAMRLVEGQELDLDRPIQDYTSAFPPKRWAITTRHLLLHQSGIRHYGGPRDHEEQTSTIHYGAVSEALAPFKDDSLLFEPGTNSLYSTYGYNVLGCVLEGAAHKSFMDVVRSLIFEPCGMASTRDDDPLAVIPHRAAGYIRVNGALRNATHVDMSNRLPAGGYLTTAPDLARFAAQFMDGALVSRETRDVMLREQTLKNGDTINYGMGWAIVEDMPGHPAGPAFHGGSSPGASGLLYIDPARRLGVVLLSNLEDAPERLEIAQPVARIVLEGLHVR